MGFHKWQNIWGLSHLTRRIDDLASLYLKLLNTSGMLSWPSGRVESGRVDFPSWGWLPEAVDCSHGRIGRKGNIRYLSRPRKQINLLMGSIRYITDYIYFLMKLLQQVIRNKINIHTLLYWTFNFTRKWRDEYFIKYNMLSDWLISVLCVVWNNILIEIIKKGLGLKKKSAF